MNEKTKKAINNECLFAKRNIAWAFKHAGESLLKMPPGSELCDPTTLRSAIGNVERAAQSCKNAAKHLQRAHSIFYQNIK